MSIPTAPADAVWFAYWARTAGRAGFEYALSRIRFTAGYRAGYQHESVSFSQALLQATAKRKVRAAILPGPWHPAVVARQLATIARDTDEQARAVLDDIIRHPRVEAVHAFGNAAPSLAFHEPESGMLLFRRLDRFSS